MNRSYQNSLAPVRRARVSGAALIMVLSLISLMTILLVGFLASMQIDRAASRAQLDGQQAGWYAQAGVDLSIAKLKALTTSTVVWASMPGRIVVIGNGGSASTNIDLSSGSPQGVTDPKVVANLNPKTLLFSSKGLIAQAGDTISTRWIYVRRDGSFETVTPPAYSKNNPVQGRFAYWVDDESARVNINTAELRSGNANALSHPSRVDLTPFLDVATIGTIKDYRKARPFHSLLEARRVVNTDAFNTNLFALTYINHAPVPSMNMFGEPRILLTTQKSVAEKVYGVGTTNYLDILTSADIDPGPVANNDPVKVGKVVKRIADYLRRTDWPILPGKSFAQKYAPFSTTPSYNNNYVAQLALNIVDYVRCAESTFAAVPATIGHLDPVSGDFSAGTSGTAVNAGSSGVSPVPYWTSNFPSTMVGVTRGPRITEFRCIISGTSPWKDNPYKNFWYWSVKYELEVTLPDNCGLTSLDLSTLTLSGICLDPTGLADSGITSTTSITSAMCSGGSTILTPGTYKTITASGILQTKPPLPVSETVPPTTQPPLIYARATITPNGDSTAVISGFGNSTAPIYFQTFTLSAGTTTASCARRYADLMLPGYPEVWSPAGPSSFGVGTPGAITSVTATPAQDKDGSGSVTPVGVRLPAPKGSATNPLGLVQSVGELGFVHTGAIVAHMHTSPTSGMLYGALVPYRTLRLRPQDAGSADLPDWALLDLFDAPAMPQLTDSAVLRPGNASVGGQINLNGGLVTFTDASGKPTLTRSVPMQCALAGAGNQTGSPGNIIPPSTLPSLAASIISYPFNDSGLAVNGKRYGTGVEANAFISPWQLCEIKGIADSGEASEEVVRQVAAVATVRGNVFGVYSVGQSIKQDSGGGITVLGERRVETLIERYQDTATSSATFRTIFTRDLRSL